MKLKSHSVGLALGGLFAIWHALWSTMVALGLAKPMVDFIFAIHFLGNPYVLKPFSLVTAGILVAVTFGLGYALGYVFALLWNKFKK